METKKAWYDFHCGYCKHFCLTKCIYFQKECIRLHNVDSNIRNCIPLRLFLHMHRNTKCKDFLCQVSLIRPFSSPSFMPFARHAQGIVCTRRRNGSWRSMPIHTRAIASPRVIPRAHRLSIFRLHTSFRFVPLLVYTSSLSPFPVLPLGQQYWFLLIKLSE